MKGEMRTMVRDVYEASGREEKVEKSQAGESWIGR
jgi:hypothetical protein